MERKVGPGQVIGLGLSFGVTLLVSIVVMYVVGRWIDNKLGLENIFAFIGVLMGIFSAFRVLLDNAKDLERPHGREYDAWKEEEDRKRLAEEEARRARKAERRAKWKQK